MIRPKKRSGYVEPADLALLEMYDHIGDPPEAPVVAKMPRPHWAQHPLAFAGFALSMAVAVGGGARLYWISGIWTPSIADGIVALVGLVLTAACIIPDHIRLRSQGDDYVRRIAMPKAWSPLCFVLAWVVWFILVFPVLMLAVDVHGGFRGPATAHFQRGLDYSYHAGVALGMLVWYPHWKAVWKRMWELYQADATVRP